MKKRIVFFIAAIILAIILISGTILAVANTNNDITIYNYDFPDPIVKETLKGKTISVDICNSKENLTYYNTMYTKIYSSEKGTDNYGEYDIYRTSDESVEYCYLSNSEILCGFLYSKAIGSGFVKNRVDDHYINIANEYLKNFFGTDKTVYTFVSCTYDELMSKYEIRYVNSYNGYDTEDSLRIWVTDEGKVVMLSARELGRYSKLDVSENALKEANIELDKKVNTALDGSEILKYTPTISFSSNGKTVLCAKVSYLTGNGDNSSIASVKIFTVIIDREK